MKFLYALAAVAIAVGISSLADVYLKKSQLSLGSYMFWGIVLYAVAAPIVAIGFKLVDFSVVFFIWEAVAIILGITLGILVFHEQPSLMKAAAFFFSLIALLFSYLSSK